MKQRDELLKVADGLLNDAFLFAPAHRTAIETLAKWAKSQLSRQPEAADEPRWRRSARELLARNSVNLATGTPMHLLEMACADYDAAVRALSASVPEAQGASIPEVSIEELRHK